MGVERGLARGKAEGLTEGKRESLLLILNSRFGKVPVRTERAISAIESANCLDELTRLALLVNALEEFKT